MKNDLYIDKAVDLLKQVALDSLTAAGLACSDVDTLVTVSSTGVAVPTLDVRLMEELPFRRNVQRLPLFGLGCAGGALGLARAAACARAQPGSCILCLVVELCTLTFCRSDRMTANIVATALFGDGAAGAVLTTDGPGPAIRAWGEHTWPRSLDVMGWHVTQNGLEVRLSRGVPDVARHRVRRVTDEFLASVGLELADVDDFICHPGGSKVLEALEDAFGLPSGGLAASREILRDYGNMSAATVLFILKRVLDDLGRRQQAARRGAAVPDDRAGTRLLDRVPGVGISLMPALYLIVGFLVAAATGRAVLRPPQPPGAADSGRRRSRPRALPGDGRPARRLVAGAGRQRSIPGPWCRCRCSPSSCCCSAGAYG